MKTLYLSAAIIALAGAASAQDAFITQLGDDNQAANLSFNTFTPDPNTQVIYQNGDDQIAVQIADGNGNQAWSYQLAETAPFGPIFGVGGGNVDHESLVIQEGDDNTAINVALDNNAIFGLFPGRGANQQILQQGDDNVAINWSQDSANPFGSLIDGTQPAPTAALTITPLGVPAFGATVNGPFGGAFTVGAALP